MAGKIQVTKTNRCQEILIPPGLVTTSFSICKYSRCSGTAFSSNLDGLLRQCLELFPEVLAHQKLVSLRFCTKHTMKVQ